MRNKDKKLTSVRLDPELYDEFKLREDVKMEVEKRIAIQMGALFEEVPDEIKKIHNIERRNVKGLVLEKERFFFNKSKLIFLKEG